MELVGKSALVTGGATRVGRAIVLELARAGCDVAIHYRRSRDKAFELADQVRELGRRVCTAHGDLNAASSWELVIEECVAGLGRLDILVNNAAEFLTEQPDTIEAFDPALWEQMLRTNLIAPVGLIHSARRHLEAHGHGKIVNLCDSSANRPWPRHLAYCASKAGLTTLTKALSKALAPTIQVNGVAPGIAEFPDVYPEEHRQSLVDRVPLGRAGTAAEIAGVVRFLVENADYITGKVIAVDGGLSIV